MDDDPCAIIAGGEHEWVARGTRAPTTEQHFVYGGVLTKPPHAPRSEDEYVYGVSYSALRTLG